MAFRNHPKWPSDAKGSAGLSINFRYFDSRLPTGVYLACGLMDELFWWSLNADWICLFPNHHFPNSCLGRLQLSEEMYDIFPKNLGVYKVTYLIALWRMPSTVLNLSHLLSSSTCPSTYLAFTFSACNVEALYPYSCPLRT